MLHDRYSADRIFSRWRVRPCYGEDIRSYFARLVADNADCTPVIYALNMGLNHHDRQGMLEAVLRLPLTDGEKESLVQWTPTGFRNLSFNGNILARERLSGLRRYCVKCVGEGAYSRIWWSVSKFCTCPFHDTLLIEETAAWHRAKFPYFGFHRGGVEDRPSLTERGSASFEGYILQKMGAVATGIARPLLDDHPLDEILSIVPAVGRFLGNPYSRKAPAFRVEDGDIGFEALGRDDDHFEDKVSAWIEAHADVKSFRYASQAYLGHAAHIWNGKNVPVLQQRLVALLNRACGRFGSLGRTLRNKDLVGISPNGRDMQRELGVTVYGLDVLRQRLKMDVERSGDGVLKYTPQIIASLASEIKSLVPISQVAVALGCSVRDANRICLVLARKGWRGAIGVRVGNKVIRHVFRSDLDSFLNVLSALPEKPADAETISVERFVRQARKASIAGTMIGVLTGQLPAYRGGSQGLRSVVLPRPPKRKFGGKPAIIGRRFLPKDAMRVTEFLAITGIRSSGIKFLLRMRHLELLEPGSQLLSRNSAITFHQRYVNLARYSALGTIVVRNALSLSKYGLTTAFAYRDVGGLITERSALAACIGPLKEYSPEEQRRWKELRRAGAKNCPSFLIPSIMGDGDMIVYTSSRKLFFRVLSLPEALIFKLRLHPGESPRALRIYRANEEAIRRLLTSFTWMDEDGATVIQATANTSTEIESITLQLGELTGFFRYKMP